MWRRAGAGPRSRPRRPTGRAGVEVLDQGRPSASAACLPAPGPKLARVGTVDPAVRSGPAVATRKAAASRPEVGPGALNASRAWSSRARSVCQGVGLPSATPASGPSTGRTRPRDSGSGRPVPDRPAVETVAEPGDREQAPPAGRSAGRPVTLHPARSPPRRATQDLRQDSTQAARHRRSAWGRDDDMDWSGTTRTACRAGGPSLAIWGVQAAVSTRIYVHRLRAIAASLRLGRAAQATDGAHKLPLAFNCSKAPTRWCRSRRASHPGAAVEGELPAIWRRGGLADARHRPGDTCGPSDQPARGPHGRSRAGLGTDRHRRLGDLLRHLGSAPDATTPVAGRVVGVVPGRWAGARRLVFESFQRRP